MTNLGCQLDCFWDQLKHKLLGLLGGVSFIRSFEAGKHTLDVGGAFWRQPRKRGHERRNGLGLFPSLSLSGLSVPRLQHPFSSSSQGFSGLPTQAAGQQLCRNPAAHWCQTETTEPSSLVANYQILGLSSVRQPSVLFPERNPPPQIEAPESRLLLGTTRLCCFFLVFCSVLFCFVILLLLLFGFEECRRLWTFGLRSWLNAVSRV